MNDLSLIILMIIIILQLKERELKLANIWILPVIVFCLLINIFLTRQFTLVMILIFIGLFIFGGVVGSVRALTTTLRLDADHNKIYSRGSYLVLIPWIVVFILRLMVEYSFGGSIQQTLNHISDSILFLIAGNLCAGRGILLLKAKKLLSQNA
ncbi:phosphoglycerol transferase MdoB-like AlkP superfamily enzyme [Scopulibacillus daqui]|uniref:Phosphoglycerol transferase MdoB-like AlkP superfamily enzyme n=1 Tax=Scopulibacillus daqui TaxID=1469162 RepID=A0ABS2PV22_9BACL|nr:DUF1453 family protein [Scopulibacillus daqui]MBM7643892.1 phosphoglycerol transferase MdoB-like AlkP superfamily enzyme [Scopulibacillus daqui]